jgi:hypothetical protein
MFASGLLGTYGVVERQGTIAVGTPERAGVLSFSGVSPAIAVSADRVAIASIDNKVVRLTLLDRHLRTLATTELGPAERGTRVVWNSVAAEWIVAWSSFDPMTRQDIAALEKRGQLVPISNQLERVHVARLTGEGALIASNTAADGEVIDLALVSGRWAVLTQRLAHDLPCKPALPSVHEIRSVMDGARREKERRLVRGCRAGVRGRLVALEEGAAAIVSACAHDDVPQLVALRFDSGGAPASGPFFVGKTTASHGGGPMFDAIAWDNTVRVVSIDAGRLVVTTLDATAQPMMTESLSAVPTDARAVAFVPNRSTGAAVAVLGDSRSSLFELNADAATPPPSIGAAPVIDACRNAGHSRFAPRDRM